MLEGMSGYAAAELEAPRRLLATLAADAAVLAAGARALGQAHVAAGQEAGRCVAVRAVYQGGRRVIK